MHKTQNFESQDVTLLTRLFISAVLEHKSFPVHFYVFFRGPANPACSLVLR